MYILAPNQTAEKYPYSIGQLRRDNPQTSFPRNPSESLLAQYDVFPVLPTPQPEIDPMAQRIEEATPVLSEGDWLQVWSVIDLTPEEIAQRLLELQQSIVTQTQQRLDDFATTRNYDGILSATSYVASTVEKFRLEAEYCVQARDETWSTLYQILAEVESGQRPIPSSYEDIEADLPVLEWP
jgi:hypothetical protein